MIFDLGDAARHLIGAVAARAQSRSLRDTDDTKWLRHDIERKHNTAYVLIPLVDDVPPLNATGLHQTKVRTG